MFSGIRKNEIIYIVIILYRIGVDIVNLFYLKEKWNLLINFIIW